MGDFEASLEQFRSNRGSYWLNAPRLQAILGPVRSMLWPFWTISCYYGPFRAILQTRVACFRYVDECIVVSYMGSSFSVIWHEHLSNFSFLLVVYIYAELVTLSLN